MPRLRRRGKAESCGLAPRRPFQQRVGRLALHEFTIAYAAAKSALSTYDKALSKEPRPKGIRVNAVARVINTNLRNHGGRPAKHFLASDRTASIRCAENVIDGGIIPTG
jgi:NAD(P)-dependent dehydrogenase (short-subunit alcohol dehydrogenase family)